VRRWLICSLLALSLCETRAQETSPFTGLIVDARGLRFTPCMFPRIYSDGGKEVWATYSVSSQFANDVGVAAFTQSFETASSLKDRGGPNQLVVRALRVTNQCDATLSDADTERVLVENRRSRFLEGFKITFLY
jgi:hypothetical protein